MKSHRIPQSLRRLALSLLAAGGLSSALAGCHFDAFGLMPPKAPPPPADSLVLRRESLDTLTPEKQPEVGTSEARLAGAHELFRRGEYSKAADLYHSLSDKSRNPESVVIEAIFYEAECLRLQGRYPPAADTYSKLLKLAPASTFRDQACLHLFEIANYWLDDMRQEMKEEREVREGKRTISNLRLVHFDKTMPFASVASRALEKLEQVHYTDIKGELGLGDKALFLCGSVKFYQEDYREADHFFTQLHENYPNSPYAPQAIELGVISKHLSTGGPDYDGRKAAEARILIDTAIRNYPELAREKTEFLTKQIYSITMQQAAKDFNTAEFYRRTGHPGSAWFYYELVRMRYPNTEYYEKATERMHEIKSKVEKEQGRQLPPIGPPGSSGVVPTAPRNNPSAELAPAPRPVPPGGIPDELAPAPRTMPRP